MKKNKIAMLLAVALTFTQSAAVPAATGELAVVTVEEDSEAEVTSGSDENFTSEEDEKITIQDDAEEGAFSAGDDAEPTPGLTPWPTVGPTPGVDPGTTDPGETEEKEYYLSMGFEGSRGDNTLVPGTKNKIWTKLENDEGEVSDYRVEVETVVDEETGEDYSPKAGFTVEGKSIIVTTNNLTGYVEYRVKIFVDGKTVIDEHHGFVISEYAILLDDIVDEEGNIVNPEVDAAININEMNPRLVHYNENGSTTEETDYEIELSEYDTDGWTLQENEGQKLPTLIRKDRNTVYFLLTAKKKDADEALQTVASRVYEFEALPYDDGDDGDDDDDNGSESDEWHNDTSETDNGYAMKIDYADTIGNGAMLPYSEMTITTWLGTQEIPYGPEMDYKLEVVSQSRLGTATVTENGKNLLINSKGLVGNGCCYVSVQTPYETGKYKEIFRKDIYFSVSDKMISPQVLVDKSGNKLNPKVGESINLAELGIGLMEYREGELYPVGDPNLKIEVGSSTHEGSDKIWYDYDESGWTMQMVPGQDLPIMTRTTTLGTFFSVTAFEVDEYGKSQVARKTYYFDEIYGGPSHVHAWGNAKVLKEATCVSVGTFEYRCECGETKTEPIPARGHTVVKDTAVAPTAVSAGKTEGSHCFVCGAVIKKQNTVAKIAPTVSLTASSLKMKTGQSTTAFRATGFAAGDYVTKVVSSKPGTVKVTNVTKTGSFKLTAGKKKGTATVTVYLASNMTKSFKVTVQKGAVKTTKITTSTRNLTLKKREIYKKLASSVVVAPVTSKEKITYSSSNKKVATVNSKGVIKAKKAGTAKITIKSGSKKVVVTVKVKKK